MGKTSNAVAEATAAEKALALAVPQGGAIVAATDFEADARAGFENADKDSYAIPFIRILQSLSPQVRRTEAEYIEGAEEGMIFNTVTREVIPGVPGLAVIPCHYKRAFIEWKPARGGFVAEHGVDSGILAQTTQVLDDKGRAHDVLPNGNEIQDSRSHYVLVVRPDGSYFPGLIAMTSSQIKKSKRWMTLMEGLKMPRQDGSKFTPPSFSHVYQLSTILDTNKKGDKFFNWETTPLVKLESAELYNAAKAFRDAITKGTIKALDPAAEAVALDEESY